MFIKIMYSHFGFDIYKLSSFLNKFYSKTTFSALIKPDV